MAALKLKDKHRAFLVKQLACYSGPKEAADALKEQFGIEIDPRTVEHYDPTKSLGQNLAKRWKALFADCRKWFLEHIEESIPIANKAVRLKKAAKAVSAFEAKGNYVGMLDAMEYVAKEVGNVHTNRREVSGPNGKPIQTQAIPVEMTDDQIAAELKALGYEPKGTTLVAIPPPETKH
jgi:hypothetical protein